MKGKFFENLAAGAAKIGKPILTVVKAKSPAILAGTAILGVVAVAVTAVKCTPKYKEAVKEAEEKSTEEARNAFKSYHGDDEDVSETIKPEPLPKKEKTKIFVKTMWPMIVAILVTCASIIGSQAVNAKRIATLSAAYTLATQKATEAAEKKAEEFIKDKMGPEAASDYKKEREAEHEADNRVIQSAMSNSDIYETGGGNQLFIDEMTGIKYRSSTGYIQSRVECFNANALSCSGYGSDDFMTYNELLYTIVPDAPSIKLGDLLGYSADDLCTKKSLSPRFDENIIMPNGEVAIMVRMSVSPTTRCDD